MAERLNARALQELLDKPVQDAGSEAVGKLGEAFRCTHCTNGCNHCGGTGYRKVCNRTACHEYGCTFGSCSATREEFERDEIRRQELSHG